METKTQPGQRWERATAPPEDWRNLILASTQEEEVVGLVRDHMARWSPEEIARLPEECRPPRIRDAEDISRWAFELASTHCAQSLTADEDGLLDSLEHRQANSRLSCQVCLGADLDGLKATIAPAG